MIKGPLVTQAEKSSSDPRWKRGDVWSRQDTRHLSQTPTPTSPLQLPVRPHPQLGPSTLAPASWS